MLKKNIDCWYDDGHAPVKLKIDGAVFAVSDIAAGDHGMSFTVSCYRDETKSDLLYSVPYAFIKELVGVDAESEAYAYLKQRPEFAGSVEI